jgi:hypothetical protein
MVMIIGGVVLAIAVVVVIQHLRLRTETLDAAAQAMERVESRSRSTVLGKKDGQSITVVVTRDRWGWWTMVTCAVADMPFELELRRQGEEEKSDIVEGRAVDVGVGDPTFDEKWLVEGAPTDIVRRVLTESIRDRFTALAPLDLCQPSKRLLRLRLGGIAAPEWISDAIALMSALGAAIEPAFAASDLDASLKGEGLGAPYRAEIRPSVTAAARAQELERLHEARSRRAWVNGLRGAAVVIAFGIIALAAYVMQGGG